MPELDLKAQEMEILPLHHPCHCRRPVHDASDIDPASILMNPHYNKGTAFTNQERQILGLEGLIPAAVETIETQVHRCYSQLNKFTVPMSKHIYLSSLRERNETLFYRVLVEHLEELMPYIYTPTVGQACQEYGLQFRQTEGMYISSDNKGKISSVFQNWKPNVMDLVSIIVVTDGSRILGLGDLGACGMGISVGKLALYVAAGGFHPATILPIVIDAGTNNETLLNDEFYLGKRHKRLDDESYYALMDEFMTAVTLRWPQALLQFEDFSNNHCFTLLEKYRHKQLCFNDDIQGTGAVVAAGFLNAIKLTSLKPEDSRVVFLGAGAAGIGVADQISRVLQARFNLTDKQCKSIFYMIDSKGLVTTSRGDKLADFKIPYARDDNTEEIVDLLDVVKKVKPHALIGLSGQAGAFNKEVLDVMAANNNRPIVFPLSNPTANAECSYQEAFDATEGRVIFASGSPFPTITTKDGVVHTASQGNNLYTFPGLGFGAWLSKSKAVSNEMITEATLALADSTSEEELKQGQLYPPLHTVREVSASVAARVVQSAQKLGLAGMTEVPSDYVKYVKGNQYFPNYLEWESKPTPKSAN